ncbi:uncharacterized protein PHACADRAFT_26798 [Phanerochaete carnosa HHB-10118-sp]|uniref:Uncharacterized protein n=1 Tax=Phanerochaete carnosa (strain HHB-10118-sp) TaxID=650164 RepID=K5V6F1_PHACS|nr:uncharacterized protein PHACADRAFT_26798 [Phanerochaete carnosa HHB-10118-sp]EKM58281.1 hypothetical protein PHACADRAFT_26798 [Phanerochaete carnosa HHB-10118-sp]
MPRKSHRHNLKDANPNESYPPAGGKIRHIRGWRTFFSAGLLRPSAPHDPPNSTPSESASPLESVAPGSNRSRGPLPQTQAHPARDAGSHQPKPNTKRRAGPAAKVDTWPWDPKAYPVRRSTAASARATGNHSRPSLPADCIESRNLFVENARPPGESKLPGIK